MLLAYLEALGTASHLSFEKTLPHVPAIPEGSAPVAWVKRFSTQENPPYRYPAPELHVKLDFAPAVALKTFRVVVGELDSYRFFCLNQVLLAHKINYAYYKTEGHIRLIVTTQDESYLRSVLKELQRYEITYEIHQS